VAVCPAVTVWLAGWVVMEGRVGWGWPLDVLGELEEAQPAKDRPRHRVTNRSLAGNGKGVRVTERSKTTIGFAGPAGPGLEGYLRSGHDFIYANGQFRVAHREQFERA